MSFLRNFHNIVSDQSQSFEQKVASLLRFGLDVFHLDLAIVSQVAGNTYTVLHAITPDNSLAAGTQFDLAGTYCVHTLAANHALAFHRASTSCIANHPCYQNFQLESYIGAPIKVGTEIFGTVNFSSPDASAPFSQQAHDYVELLAQWLGFEFARKISNEQLIKNNNTLLKLESVANIGTWEVDLITNRTVWSQQTRRIYQVDDDYVPELNTAIMFFKEGTSRDKVIQAVENAIQGAQKWNLELELITAQQECVWVSTFGEAEYVNGRCVRLFGTLQNVTESVLLREKLKKKTAQAQRMLEDRSMMFAKISHELRTPLNGITGMLSVLLDEPSEEKRVEKLNIALRSADLLLNIINEVLDYSKINHGELKLEPNHFLLKTTFLDLASLYIPLFKDKQLELQTTIAIEDNCWAYCDNTRLSQIVANLLSNALKFTETGWVKFSVNVSEVADKLLLNIEVSDTGRGMTEKFIDSLFSPFTQEVDSKNNKGGTGLGLAIVKELVEYMQGTIKVNSTFNEGTTFLIRIPLDVGTEQQHITRSYNVDTAASKLTVLVVDDNQINRQVLNASLNKLNINADFAHDGQDAVNKCKRKHYELIFMDCVMPELDGLAATRILRKDNICPVGNTVIVALTANTSSADQHACKEAGMDLFISKPFKLHSIEEVVAATLEKLTV